MTQPLFRSVDCVMVHVDNLEAGLDFYVNKLGHTLNWKSSDSAGLSLADSEAELVLHTKIGPETDLLVDNVDSAFSKLIESGATSIMAPFDIRIGRCAVVLDPWGNQLTMLDMSKGSLKIDKNRNVIENES